MNRRPNKSPRGKLRVSRAKKKSGAEKPARPRAKSAQVHRQDPIHVAHHEAGHFVAAYHFNPNNGDEVSIVPSNDGALGHHTSVYGLEGQERATTHEERVALEAQFGSGTYDVIEEYRPEDVNERVIVLLAGAEAELRLDQRRGSVVRSGARSDMEEVRKLIHAEHLEDLRARARALVDEHWVEVAAVAAELVKRRRLDGVEAGFICDVARGEPDAEAHLERYRALLAATARMGPKPRR